MGWLTLPQSTSFSDVGSFTTNLSLGERPVCGVVMATNGPISVNSPSSRRAAALKSSGAIKFQWTSPGGYSPCLARPMLLSRAASARWGLISVAIPRLPLTDPLLRVHHGDRGHIHDVLPVGALLEHVNGKIHTDQERTDLRRTAEVVQKLVRDIPRAQVGKYQHVRPVLQHAERIRRPEDVLVHRRVRLHLTVDDERRVAFSQNRNRFRHFLGFGMAHRPEVRERQHRYFRCEAEGADDPPGRISYLRQLLCGRIDVDRRVAKEDNVLLEHEHVETAHDLGLWMRSDHLQRGADRLGVVHTDAGEQSIGVSARDHY